MPQAVKTLVSPLAMVPIELTNGSNNAATAETPVTIEVNMMT